VDTTLSLVVVLAILSLGVAASLLTRRNSDEGAAA
jgi:hypothetical protein